MPVNRSRSDRGFTLIELLIVVAILGIIAAILIPNLLESLQKSRQKRTMAAMREIAVPLSSYWSDNGGAAAAGVTINVADWTATTAITTIADALIPDYTSALNAKDGWGRDLELRIHISRPPKRGFAMMRSPGSDGALDGSTYESGSFRPSDYDQDIVWADGTFVRAPASAGGT